MKLVRRAAEVRAAVKKARDAGKVIGTIPTMGALHAAHLSLIDAVAEHCDFLVLWNFVNPTQFNDPADYERYPRDLEKDCQAAESKGVDIVFAPEVEEIYPRGTEVYSRGEMARVRAGDRSQGLEGERRPGHFDGVVHVCAVMFNIIQPDFAVFGEKDYQQVQVIEQLIEELHYDIKIVRMPIHREATGLAMSSRNQLLDTRESGLGLSRAIQAAEKAVASGERSAEALRAVVEKEVVRGDLRLEYVAVVDPETLQPIDTLERDVQLLLAAFTANNVRLIDTTRLTVP